MEPDKTAVTAMRRLFVWMFRDRRTGKIVIVQLPNLPLFVFLVASAIRRFSHPKGRVGTITSYVIAASLLGWAAGEVVRGVNPFRRILGVVVGAITVVGMFLR